jgi:hypothetical protein
MCKNMKNYTHFPIPGAEVNPDKATWCYTAKKTPTSSKFLAQVGREPHFHPRKAHRMKIFFPLLVLPAIVSAQGVKTARQSKLAAVTEQIGITTVTINYSRPAVNNREGKIWGDLVPYGFVDYHYGTSKAAPWRAGANENTTIDFSTDVTIEGRPLAAGKYGFFVGMGAEKATLVFSKDNNAWGSFYYNAASDALRVEVPVRKATDNIEWLKYEFTAETDSTATALLQWEKMRIPITVGVDIKKTQVEAYRHAFNSGAFYEYWQNMQQAADFCLANNVNIEEGLSWADRSIHTFFGEANFKTLSTYSGLLEKVGRNHEADSCMKLAWTKGNPGDFYDYGYRMQTRKKYPEALQAFKAGYDKQPNEWLANFYLAKGYAGVNDKAAALKYADAGAQLAPDKDTKAFIQRMRQDIADGKDVTFH